MLRRREVAIPPDYSTCLAIYGGPKAARRPFTQANRPGEAEKRCLFEVIDSDTLFSFLGFRVRAFEQRFRKIYGMEPCIACSSGTRRSAWPWRV